MRNKRLVRAAAVFSSVILVSGYLFYKAHAGGGGKGERAFPGSKSGAVYREDGGGLGRPESTTAPAGISLPVAATQPAAEPRILPGSKSDIIIDSSDQVVAEVLGKASAPAAGAEAAATAPQVGAAHATTQPAAAPATRPSEGFKLR